MKILWQNTYQGIHQTTRPNKPTQLLYLAKFLHRHWAIKQISLLLWELLIYKTDLLFDVIIPAPCTRSHFCLPEKLALNISENLAVPVIFNFFTDPHIYNLNNKHLLIIDDVIQTGKTLNVLRAFIQNYYKPASMTFVAYLASPTFQLHTV